MASPVRSPKTMTDYLWYSCMRVLPMVAILLSASGCLSFDYGTMRRVAHIIDYGSADMVEARKTPRNRLTEQLSLKSWSGPTPSPRVQQTLQRHSLSKLVAKKPSLGLEKLAQITRAEFSLDNVYALAELSYIYGRKAKDAGKESRALELYVTSTANAYRYLFDQRFDRLRSHYDPTFRGAAELYNAALEGTLRVLSEQKRLNLNRVESFDSRIDVSVVPPRSWRGIKIARFAFPTDYEVIGLNNRHQTFGLGVPLIAVQDSNHEGDAGRYYPNGLSLSVTALVRAVPEIDLLNKDTKSRTKLVVELFDSLNESHVEVGGRLTPLEADLTTPLAYYLNDPVNRTSALPTFAILDNEFGNDVRGLYMFEPYRPEKIPVVMVHGLWSHPATWMEMYNELRAFPEIRKNYQFWFYLYPTNQPFWVSAKEMRDDLASVKQTLISKQRSPAFDHMVLVGHSMGGLISKLQTLDSGDDFWRILSDRPFEELNASEATRRQLRDTLFFRANPSVRRLVTIASPHRGSNFANPTTQWLSRSVFAIPEMLAMSQEKLVRDNPGFFHDKRLLTIHTSTGSLAPDSPFLPVMLRARHARWTKYHNIIGRRPKSKDDPNKASDGLVTVASATLDDVDSEIVVAGNHTSVNELSECVLEVQRILLENLAEMQEASRRITASAPEIHSPRTEITGSAFHRPSTAGSSVEFSRSELRQRNAGVAGNPPASHR